MSRSSAYWSVDLPGLTREGAEAVVRFTEGRFGVVAALVASPDEFLVLQIDRETADSVVAGLRGLGDPDSVALAFSEILEDWVESLAADPL